MIFTQLGTTYILCDVCGKQRIFKDTSVTEASTKVSDSGWLAGEGGEKCPKCMLGELK